MFVKNYEYDGHKYLIMRQLNSRTIVAKSTFAGKEVVGISRCHPNDTFNLEIGIKLAILRCNVKLGKKKIARSKKNYQKSEDLLHRVSKRHEKCTKYVIDAKNFYDKNVEELEKTKKWYLMFLVQCRKDLRNQNGEIESNLHIN